MSDTQIKICGLKAPEEIEAAVSAGASHVGLVQFEKSPRHISLEQARALSEIAPAQVKTVLLLVSMGPEETAKAIAAVQPDVVQLHGAETPEWCAALKNSLGRRMQMEIWKAVGVKDEAALARAQKYVGAVDRILYDAPAGKLPGGQGIRLDWSLLANFKHAAPWGLAGGLTAENVGDAIRQTKSPLVDTSSGVESAPGIKDVNKIRAFCRAAREA